MERLENGSTTTSSNLLDSHPLPHQQFSSLIAFANSPNSVNKVKYIPLSNKKSTRLPPLTRFDSVCSPPISEEYIPYFNRSAESSEPIENANNNGFDPYLRIKQLERNISFVKEDCHLLLQSLHNELEDLKIKNRDLQFQLISNGLFTSQSAYSPTKEQVVIMPLIRGALNPQIGEYITKLENEVKRLRIALGETIKTNSLLKQEIQKRNQQKSNDSKVNLLSSPTINDFNQTFQEINDILQNKLNLPRISNIV